MANEERSGFLVALEGIDGSGTTTQIERLTRRIGSQLNQPAWNRVAAVYATREPSTGTIGRLLREVLGGARDLDPATVALLFAADRLDHWCSEVEPHLRRGELVLSDRYVYSSLAYQSTMLDERWVFAINARAPEPDLTIYLRIDPERAEARRALRATSPEIYERRDVQQAVAQRYDDLLGSGEEDGAWCRSEDGRWRHSGSPRVRHGRHSVVAIIDGSSGIAELEETLCQLILAVVQRQGGQ